MVKVTPARLPEVLIVEPRVFGDARGFFMESWNEKAFNDATGLNIHFVQDNHSRSARGVLRGMHYQLARPQGKLVRVVAGRVFDAVVDMRRSSPRLGQWMGMELDADSKRQLWIPPGFAHGFLVLSEHAEFLYKTSDYYVPEDEHTLAWNDAHAAIQWPLGQIWETPLLSSRDADAASWAQAALFD